MIKFNRDDPVRFKEQYPDAVIFIGDENKNPGRFMGAGWNQITTQTQEELLNLLEKADDVTRAQ